MVPRLKSYSEPPFLKRGSWVIPVGGILLYAATALLGVMVPALQVPSLVGLAILMGPLYYVGFRDARRWKKLLVESEGYICPWCGYNMRAIREAEICPECGKEPAAWRGW